MRVRFIFLFLGVLLLCSAVFGESPEQGDAGGPQLRIYQEHYPKQGVLIFKKEWIGYEGTLTEKITMNAVYPDQVGKTVTYNLYFGDRYLDSCEVPYGEGEECYIEIDVPAGSTLEGKTYQIVSGYGIEDFDIYILEPGEPVPLVTTMGDAIGSNETIDEELNEPEEELNETEEIAPLCEGISCADYCEGDTLYSEGTCNPETGECEHSGTVCQEGCNAESAKCIRVFGNVQFDVFLEEQEAIATGSDTVTATVRLIEEGVSSIEPIGGADITIELTAPESEHVFWETGGSLVVEGKTDSYGVFEATFEVPHWEEFYLGRQKGSTPLEVRVDASKHDSSYDFDYSDGPHTIEVFSPAIVIGKISISPNPAQAYQEHEISITVLDDDVQGPAHVVVKVPEGVLSYNDFGGKLIGEYGGGIGFDSYGDAVVHWQAPERGLTPYEFDYAKEPKEVLSEYGTQSGMTLVKTAGYFVPVIDVGKDVYGMYDDTMDIWEEKQEFSESLSAREKVYRGTDITLSGIKLGVGAINLYTNKIPLVGKVSDWTADSLDAGISTGEIYLKEAAAEERLAQMETRSMDMFVEVDVVDADGYTDTNYFIFEMEYLWEKEE